MIYCFHRVLGPESSETLKKVSVSTSFAQSRWVSVSASTKIPSLEWVSVLTSTKTPSLDESRSSHAPTFPSSDESQSQHLLNFMVWDESRSWHLSYLPVSMSLGLNTFKLSVGVCKEVFKTIFWSIFIQKMPTNVDQKIMILTRLISLDWNYSLSLKFETLGIKVSVSVSNLRLWISNSRSWIWDFGYKSLSLEFKTLEIAVSASNLRR